jgi:hypothetical protein
VDETLSRLVLLSGAIALGFLVAVAFYESLCYRDVLVGRTMRVARRLSGRPAVHGVAYGLAVGVGVPVLVVLWAVVLEFTLVVVGSVQRLGNVALIAAAIVAATRILAYIREKTAHELAKAIPLSLAILLLTGGTLYLDANLETLAERQELSDLTPAMVTFLVALEIGLRLVTDASHAILAAIRRRRGIDDHAGVWRTIWSGLRRPVRSS